jgi:hypothetical protein
MDPPLYRSNIKSSMKKDRTRASARNRMEDHTASGMMRDNKARASSRDQTGIGNGTRSTQTQADAISA